MDLMPACQPTPPGFAWSSAPRETDHRLMTSERDLGFTWELRKDGTLVIRRSGALVTIVRGDRAARLHARLRGGDEQQVLARWTGNYRHGNERRSAEHARNRRPTTGPPVGD